MEQGIIGYSKEYFGFNKACSARIKYSQTYSTQTNQSNVKLELQAKSNKDAYFRFNGFIFINGNKEITSNSKTVSAKRDTWVTITEKDIVVEHAEDGTGSLRVKYEYDPKYSSTNGKKFIVEDWKNNAKITIASGTEEVLELRLIPRDSEIISVKDIDLGTACEVVWDVKSTFLYYKLRFKTGNWEYTTDYINSSVVGQYTYTGYVIPVDVARQFVNSTRAKMSVYLYTYPGIDRPQSGFSVSSFTVHLPSRYVPTINNWSITMDNALNSVVNGWGIALSGFTRFDISATSSQVYGAKITSYIVSIQDAVINIPSPETFNYTTPVIDSHGDIVISVKCVDSRGRESASVQKMVTCYKYSDPYIKSFSVLRNDSNKNRMTANVSWIYESIGGRNSSSAVLYYKEKASNSFTQYGSIYNGQPLYLNIYFDENKSYNFKVVVTDTVGTSVEKSDLTMTKEVLMDFRAGGKGMAIGKVSELDALEVAMDTRFMSEVYIKDKPLIDYIYPVGSVYMNFNPASPADLFGGGWERIYERFLYAASDTNPTYYSDLTGGEETHTLTIDEMPTHDHNLYMAQSGSDRIEEAGFSNGVGRKYTDAPIRSTGGSQPHNNMPPYLTIYMWRRVS